MPDDDQRQQSGNEAESASDPSQTSQRQGNPEGSPDNQNPQQTAQAQSPQNGDQATDDGSQSPFNHPDLQGRSPEEVERLYQLAKQTVQEQGRRLNQTHQGQTQQPQQGQQPQQRQQTAEEISDEDFWENPTQAIQRMLEQQVGPLKGQVESMTRREQIEQVDREMRSMYPDWDQVKPTIQMIQQRQNLPQDLFLDTGALQTMYLAAKGLMSMQGSPGQPQNPQMGQQARMQGQSPQAPGQYPQTQPNPNQGQPMGQQNPQQAPNPRQQIRRDQNIPQHRPSQTPMPNPQNQTAQNQKRPLTELEKRMARENGMTEDEFREWQDMGAHQVVETPEGN